MDWNTFKEHYIIEVETKSAVDVEFAVNTPLYSVNRPRIDLITEARVLDRHTFEIKRTYPIQLSSDEMRNVDNKLRRLIKRDFQIAENELSNRKLVDIAQELYTIEQELLTMGVS